jgi:hypothetical protein
MPLPTELELPSSQQKEWELIPADIYQCEITVNDCYPFSLISEPNLAATMANVNLDKLYATRQLY